MITDAEQFESAKMLVQILEQRIAQAVAARRAAVQKVINIRSNDHLFWYVSTVTGNNASIQILQDAAFIATGIHVIGQEVTGLQFMMRIRNGWPQRDATQTQNFPILDTTKPASRQQIQVSVSVPIDHFMPAYASGNAIGAEPNNVDYWYQPIAEWLIPRGDTIAIETSMNTSTVYPVVVLSGRKVSP